MKNTSCMQNKPLLTLGLAGAYPQGKVPDCVLGVR